MKERLGIGEKAMDGLVATIYPVVDSELPWRKASLSQVRLSQDIVLSHIWSDKDKRTVHQNAEPMWDVASATRPPSGT